MKKGLRTCYTAYEMIKTKQDLWRFRLAYYKRMLQAAKAKYESFKKSSGANEIKEKIDNIVLKGN